MSRKTRREKIRAEKRREQSAKGQTSIKNSDEKAAKTNDLTASPPTVSYFVPNLRLDKSFVAGGVSGSSSDRNSVGLTQTDLRTTVVSDIKRILFLTSVAICAQLVLSYLLAKGIVKLF